MGIENSDGLIIMEPGPLDAHGHGRAFDPLPEGKAGLEAYTQAMLASGIVAVNLMPNESRRKLDPETGQQELSQVPVSNPDRVGAMETAISTQSATRAGYYLGIDKKEALSYNGTKVVERRVNSLFFNAGRYAAGLKLWVDESTGGMNVTIDQAAQLASRWHRFHPEKPVIIHAEDSNVDNFLREVEKSEGGKDMPLHIAHVSSEEELTAKIEARGRGMRVTCEGTPHHLFTTASQGLQIDGFGSVKPSLKSDRDVEFLWDNMDEIDVLASDCAPHRLSDKMADPPAWGVTNHTVMMPLLFGAVAEGKLTLEELYEKVALAPRQIFNMPIKDGTEARFDTNGTYGSAKDYEAMIDPGYGQNIFTHLEDLGEEFRLDGILMYARSGLSTVEVQMPNYRKLNRNYRVSLGHLVNVR